RSALLHELCAAQRLGERRRNADARQRSVRAAHEPVLREALQIGPDVPARRLGAARIGVIERGRPAVTGEHRGPGPPDQSGTDDRDFRHAVSPPCSLVSRFRETDRNVRTTALAHWRISFPETGRPPGIKSEGQAFPGYALDISFRQ